MRLFFISTNLDVSDISIKKESQDLVRKLDSLRKELKNLGLFESTFFVAKIFLNIFLFTKDI